MPGSHAACSLATVLMVLCCGLICNCACRKGWQVLEREGSYLAFGRNLYEEVRRCGRVQSVRRGVSTRRAVEECTADRVGHTIMCTPGCFQRGAIWMKVGVALQESPAWER